MDLFSFMEAMGTSEILLIAAFFIGLMMSISPCPLATNIAAIAYISKKLGKSVNALLIGAVYTIGRMFSYVTIASLIVWCGLNMRAVSLTLQKYGDIAFGPILIISGIVLLDVIKINLFKGSSRLAALKENLSKQGYLGSFLLGVIFALAFCPFSAVLFFGMLIPLAINAGDGVVIPSVFAIATGLPVIIFSVILVYSISTLGTVVHKVQIFEKWMRRSAAVVFIIVGIYYTLRMAFRL